ncbi:MAG: carbohydrate kinase family protein [Candidatus Bathyarchaeia archaeon]
MWNDYLDEAADSLKYGNVEATVVVLPDFFIDRFVTLNCEVDVFYEVIRNVAARKGGSIDGISQKDFRGGNAANTASALASLGVNVTPIICTDKLGFKLIKHYLRSPRVDLSHVKICERSSITTALEFKIDNELANVMLRDLGSLEYFGPQNLDASDFEAIGEADYVCIFNWAGTRKHGTELAERVISHAKTRGKARTYCDTADPTPNKEEAQSLIDRVLKSPFLDILSLNENEAVFYASMLNQKIGENKAKLPLEELAKASAKTLSTYLKARVDLHAASFSASFTNKGEIVVPAFDVPVLRATGAGDTWNAGNILGDLLGLSDGARLMLANAIAAYYISNSEGRHPTRRELCRFCNKLKGKWKTKTDKNKQ